MSFAEIVMAAVALAVGVPSAWRNPTAGALVLCWIFSKVLYILTGDGLAVAFYAYPDAFVIAIIMAKQPYCELNFNDGWLHELKCLVLERSPCDRIILASYPVLWMLYAAEIEPFYQYWSIWTISIAQFLVAAFEPLSDLLRRHAEAAESDPEKSGDLLVAYPVGGTGGTWLA